MVNHRKRLPQTPKPRSVFLKGRLFAAGATSASSVDVHTYTPPPPKPNGSPPLARARYPAVNDILDTFSIQTHTHDVAVELKHGTAVSRFKIYFRRHKWMPANGFFDLQGDVLVMRMAAADTNSVVNLRSSDRRLISFIMQK
ncbi:hypothetical protein K438DRAFT_1974402 [Mycena galopus ATCC 62051]|nr:hypothetical protein K438DRAFT_1974402 [Mycena galopus ATCC 62051]